MYLGIDPGLNGAFVLVDDEGAVKEMWKMPTVNKKITAGCVADFVCSIVQNYPIKMTGIEQLLSLPADTNAIKSAVLDLEKHFFSGETVHVNVVNQQFQWIFKLLKKTDGRVGTMTMGINWGYIVGAIAAVDMPYQVYAPRTWQAAMHKGVMNAGKLDAKTRSKWAAKQLWPTVLWVAEGCRKEHDGFIDAALIAEYTRRSCGAQS